MLRWNKELSISFILFLFVIASCNQEISNKRLNSIKKNIFSKDFKKNFYSKKVKDLHHSMKQHFNDFGLFEVFVEWKDTNAYFNSFSLMYFNKDTAIKFSIHVKTQKIEDILNDKMTVESSFYEDSIFVPSHLLYSFSKLKELKIDSLNSTALSSKGIVNRWNKRKLWPKYFIPIREFDSILKEKGDTLGFKF